jgi:hypothetical protein
MTGTAEEDQRPMYCEGCGRPTLPDESGLCSRCLADEWTEVRQRANLWNVDALRAQVDERPLPKPPRRRSRPEGQRV